MPKNHPTFFELPSELPVVKRCLCAHFGCNVYHESLIFGPEVYVRAAMHSIKHAIEHSGGRLPAEHGHGTDCDAPVETKERWMRMDPTNSMNPGVGGLRPFDGTALEDEDQSVFATHALPSFI